MSGSVCAIWDQTKKLSQKQEISRPSDFELCVIFLKAKVTQSFTCSAKHCERRKVPTVWMFGELGLGYAQVFFSTTLLFVPLGKASHLPNLNIRVQRGTRNPSSGHKENLFLNCLPCYCLTSNGHERSVHLISILLTWFVY